MNSVSPISDTATGERYLRFLAVIRGAIPARRDEVAPRASSDEQVEYPHDVVELSAAARVASVAEQAVRERRSRDTPPSEP